MKRQIEVLEDEDQYGEMTALRENRLHPIGLTALFYLDEKVRNEQYEEVQEILYTAREFGAPEHQIQWILNNAGQLQAA